MTAGVLPGQPPNVEERRQRAAELYGQGLSMRQVAARLGVTPMTVHRYLSRLGTPVRQRGGVSAASEQGRSSERRARQERARRLYEEGLTLRQVGQLLGVARSTVHDDLVRAGVRLRHLRAVPDPSPATPVRFVPPQGAAVTFTAERGWHLTQAPPGWFLDLLAEVD